MMKDWFLWVIFNIAICLPSSSIAGSENNMTLALIDLSKAGSSAVVELHVSPISHLLARGNPVILSLQIVGPKKGREDLLPKFQDMIMSLTGTPYGALSMGQIAQPAHHREIKLHVLWRDKNSGAILQERDVSSGHDWQGKIHIVPGPSFTLDSMSLPSGDYEIVVTTLTDDSRFDGTFVTGLCAGIVRK
jgi:hypothetical protein